MLRRLVALTTERSVRDGLWPDALNMPPITRASARKANSTSSRKPMQMLSNTCGFAASGLQNHGVPRAL